MLLMCPRQEHNITMLHVADVTDVADVRCPARSWANLRTSYPLSDPGTLLRGFEKRTRGASQAASALGLEGLAAGCGDVCRENVPRAPASRA